MNDRVIAGEGIHNFRDYGGYAVPGGRLVTGRLFRSAQHRDASAADLARVAEIGLGHVVDLRGPGERDSAPCPRPQGFDAKIVLSEEETINPADAARYATAFDGPEAAKSALVEGYRNMPYRPHLRDLFRRYFETLLETDRPTLIHCLAGKDRTGLAVALFHTAVGVTEDDMMADYLLTNSAGNVEARVASAAAAMREMNGREMPEDALRMFMSVQPEFLQSAFASIRDRDGSVDTYLTGLGMDADNRDRLRESYLA